MLAIIYEFVKFTSSIFILAGISCFFNGLYPLGFLMFVSFLIIKLVDSDWAFEKIKFQNHNAAVIFTTFALIIINMFFVYQSMKDSPMIIRASETQKENYLSYENNLFTTLTKCSDLHNKIISENISETEAAQINSACTNTISLIEEIKVPTEKVPDSTLTYMKDLKSNFKYIALNLSHFNYKEKQSNSAVNALLQTNLSDSFFLMKKLRTMLGLPVQSENDKKNIVKLN
ncbi:MAG: hypothetical protein WC197_01875 [Candidatus Gastranaerophilaceae bacterium]|jgi:hypothetical protein